MKCDVSKEAEVEACVNKAVEEFGRLDIVVSGFVNVSRLERKVAHVLCGSSTTLASCTLKTTTLLTPTRRSGISLRRLTLKEVNSLFSRGIDLALILSLRLPLTDLLDEQSGSDASTPSKLCEL
jgi:NAD(P)-dependent dehydrogenase (short-subunit alcohol dehydrogenase family)